MNQTRDEKNEQNQAAALIRQKLESIYREEPSAKEEAAEAAKVPASQRSKHQEFMHQLTTSGKSLANIQTAWHNYYVGLPEPEKHQVWQEFYREHNRRRGIIEPTREPPHPSPSAEHAKSTEAKSSQHYVHSQHANRRSGSRTVSQIKRHINQTVSQQGKLKSKQHFQSLIFGMGLGSLVILILLFSFFNERIIAPFISPSRTVSSTPIIIDGSTAAVDNQPKIIIPKINVEIPVVYDEKSIDEAAVQRSLERGILHYPTTVSPGEKGNAAFFGHSSNNIFNKGKYKFAFVLLRKLEVGDVFYVTKDGKRYAYKVYAKQVVKPSEVGVLGAKDRPATATLITCDPPGTSINRLVVTGEQISPDPAGNVAGQLTGTPSAPQELPSDAPTLWQRIRTWLSN